MPPESIRLLSVPEVAKQLGLHEQTVRQLIRRGELGSVPVGRRVLIAPDQVAEFINRHAIDADAG